MLNLIFIILMFIIFGNMLGFAVKAAWGVSTIICTIILLPVFLIVLVIMGLIGLALPLLVVIGLISIFVMH